ncbi:MAG: PhoH family protein [Sulfurovum sp.]|nr:MAG: PhoH family protein [Sulfurovum sp.]
MARRKAPHQTGLLKNNLSILKIQPLKPVQTLFFEKFDAYPHHFLLGYAGTGKTFLALYKALQVLDEGEATSITIFRSSVASRDQGHLPGTIQEKMQPFETPYRANVNKLLGRADGYDLLKKTGILFFESTSYQRGNTLDNHVVIIDEFQSMTFHEMDTLITRMGKNSRLIICGDMMQQDLTRHSEKTVHKILPILQNLPSFHTCHFGLEDIVRSGLVKEYLMEKYKHYPDGIT